MANWTDQTQQIFTQEQFDSKWGLHGGKNYCALCNKDFQVGDRWRWIYANSQRPSNGNFSVCEFCDGPDVLNRYQAACSLLRESYKGRGEGHRPVDIAARLTAAREQIATLEVQLDFAYALMTERK